MQKTKGETRGRPRKSQVQSIQPLVRKDFSEHSAVFCTACLVFVMEIFHSLKDQRRIGHSEGSFTIYDSTLPNTISASRYCWHSLRTDLTEWGFAETFDNVPNLFQFLQSVNSIAPKFVFRELCLLIKEILNQMNYSNSQSCDSLIANIPSFLTHLETVDSFQYLRFFPAALAQLKLELWQQHVSSQVKELWPCFVNIVFTCVYGIVHKMPKNRYFKHFFKDAQRPQETLIGQLTLRQVVQQKEPPPIENDQKKMSPSPTQLRVSFECIEEPQPVEDMKKVELQRTQKRLFLPPGTSSHYRTAFDSVNFDYLEGSDAISRKKQNYEPFSNVFREREPRYERVVCLRSLNSDVFSINRLIEQKADHDFSKEDVEEGSMPSKSVRISSEMNSD